MIKEEANEFLKQVTGKKIRMGCWNKDSYTIPTGEWKNTSHLNPFWWSFWTIDQDGDKNWYYVGEGFEKDRDGEHWELVEEPIVEYIRNLEND